MIDLEFWNGRRVLVTGHTGFKGAWLIATLRRLDAEVTGFARPALAGSVFDLGHLHEWCRHVVGDLDDIGAIEQVVETAQPQIVIHMAAQAFVLPSYDDPVETVRTNVLGTAHVLDVLRRSATVEAIVNVTSDKCYANPTHGEQRRPFVEDDRLGGDDPYSASKAAADLVGRSFYASFFQHRGVGLACARSGNVIGGGDIGEHRLVPDILDACVAGAQPVLRLPDAVRPWQHVLNPLLGYLVLSEQLVRDPEAFSAGWNFGPDETDACSVGAITEMILQEWSGTNDGYDVSLPPRHEAGHLTIDATAARRALGWSPLIGLEEAIAELVSFRRIAEEVGDFRGHLLRFIDGAIARGGPLGHLEADRRV